MSDKHVAWSIHPLGNSLAGYQSVWDELNAELYASHAYFDSRMVDSLLAHFASGQEKLCVHHRGTEIDGLLIVAPAGIGQWSLFLPSQAQVVPVLLRQAESLLELLRALPGFACWLNLLSQDPLYSPVLEGFRPVLSEPIRHDHTICVRLAGVFKDYWRMRPANLRRAVSRGLRKAGVAGFVVRLEHTMAHSDMPSAVARFGAIESAGWKGRRGTAVHADNEQGRFYVELMQKFAANGNASVYALYFNDLCVAMLLAIASPSMLVLLKTTYDEHLAMFSPGQLMLHALLEREFAEKRVQLIDCYTNVHVEQMAWATDDRWISHYMLFRNEIIKIIYNIFNKLRRWMPS